MSASNIIDLLFLFLLVTFSIRGAFKGLSGEIFSIIGTLGGIFLAWKFTQPLSQIILARTSFHPALTFVCIMVSLYVSAVIVAAVLCKMVKAVIKFTQLSLIDRFLGVLAGGIKTLAIILFIYLVSSSFSSFIPIEWFDGSVTIKIGAYVWPGVESFLIQANLLDPETFLPPVNPESF